MQSITERRPLVEGFYEEYREPASEHCMKVQRSTGVNGRISEHLLIRVVPPMISVPCGLKLLAVLCYNEKEKNYGRKEIS